MTALSLPLPIYVPHILEKLIEVTDINQTYYLGNWYNGAFQRRHDCFNVYIYADLLISNLLNMFYLFYFNCSWH